MNKQITDGDIDMESIVLIGYGGHRKSVADCIERQGQFRIAGYTDFAPRDTSYIYMGTDDVLEKCFERGIRNAAICIGYIGRGEKREKVYNKLKFFGYRLPAIIDPSAIISKSAIIAEGAFVGKGAIVNAEVEIGKMTIINTNPFSESSFEEVA